MVHSFTSIKRREWREEFVNINKSLDIKQAMQLSSFFFVQDEESKRLHDELVQARKEADRARLERAETVNRLTKSLEQSQKQNEELLNSGNFSLASPLFGFNNHCCGNIFFCHVLNVGKPGNIFL